MEWLIKHLGGAILPFGQKVDKGFEKSFTLLGTEGGLMKLATAYMYVATPVLGLLFFFGIVGSLGGLIN